MSRTRTRAHATQNITTYFNGTAVATEPQGATSDTCTDTLGKSTDHPFDCVQRTWDYAESKYHNGPYAFRGYLGYGLAAPFDPNPAMNSWMSEITVPRIVAQSAPMHPSVFTVTDILEWRDIPRMIKHAGDVLHRIRLSFDSRVSLAQNKQLAAATMAYQFGWAPLVQDIGRILDFGDRVAAMQRNLLDLNSGRGLRRTVQLGKRVGTAVGSTVIHSTNNCVINPRWYELYQMKSWATIHWTLRNPAQLGKIPTWNEAFRAAYGLNPLYIALDVWKALPWSWLIDWFADTSNVLEVYLNEILYKPSRLNLMHHQQVETVRDPVPSAGVNNYYPVEYDKVGFPGGKQVYDRKIRLLPSLASATQLNLRVPFLDSFKLSIISSLTILGVKSRFR